MFIKEDNNQLVKQNEELTKKNLILSKRLRENGLDDSIVVTDTLQDVAVVIKRTQKYQGILLAVAQWLLTIEQ